MAIITISRQEGSGGDHIAKMVAERMGFVCVERETMIDATHRAGVPIHKALVPELDEKRPSFWERLDEGRGRYNLLLRYLVYDFAERDRCVIVGHGAERFLAGLQHVLRVKVVAPFDKRVKRVMETRSVSKEVAANLVRQSDRERAGYVKYLFQEDWLNPLQYDLMLNADRLSLDSVAGIIIQAAEVVELNATASSRQALSDRALVSRVEMSLLLDPRIGSSGLRVTANCGEVTISGTLATDEEKEITELVASAVPGVSRLISELVVVPLTSTLYP